MLVERWISDLTEPVHHCINRCIPLRGVLPWGWHFSANHCIPDWRDSSTAELSDSVLICYPFCNMDSINGIPRPSGCSFWYFFLRGVSEKLGGAPSGCSFWYFFLWGVSEKLGGAPTPYRTEARYDRDTVPFFLGWNVPDWRGSSTIATEELFNHCWYHSLHPKATYGIVHRVIPFFSHTIDILGEVPIV